VRTGGSGVAGISLLVIERGSGVETKPLKTSVDGSAGTALVIFNSVQVPVCNLLGRENEGFKCIMFNFNHERWIMNGNSLQFARIVLDECFKWAKQRIVFGKALIEQPVIREKLARMCASIEANANWLESIT